MTPDAGTPAPRARRRLIALVLLVELLLCAAVITAVVRGHHHDDVVVQNQRPADIPATVSTALADRMGLSPLSLAARDFTLRDQLGHSVNLKALRGRVVVVQFMDPHCTDICPIAAHETLDAYRDLGTRRDDVVFVTVNVNRYANNPSDALAFTREQGLEHVPTWHFVTGPVAALKKVWYDYDVEVVDAGPTADVVHTDQVYFVNPDGKVRYLAMTNVDYTKSGTAYLPAVSVAQWGRGIANVASSLLSN